MRAFTVAVGYSDMLQITLPWNRKHFTEYHVVTSPEDVLNVLPVAHANDAKVYSTDAFYRNGAAFNKWLALEEALDHFGRHGWICLLDADVLWPRWLRTRESSTTQEWLEMYDADSPRPDHALGKHLIGVSAGRLISPLRRMMDDLPVPFLQESVPPESEWKNLPIHRNVAEWAGYTQIFHAQDPILGPPPWHEVGWSHAGCADSIFQARWPPNKKIRPPWEVLHLGRAGENWLGRASPMLDGTVPEGADEKKRAMERIWAERRRLRSYQQERLPRTP